VLILSRKKDEEILINENIVIKVLEIRKGVVRIGIDAPECVDIQRKEARHVKTKTNSIYLP